MKSTFELVGWSPYALTPQTIAFSARWYIRFALWHLTGFIRDEVQLKKIDGHLHFSFKLLRGIFCKQQLVGELETESILIEAEALAEKTRKSPRRFKAIERLSLAFTANVGLKSTDKLV